MTSHQRSTSIALVARPLRSAVLCALALIAGCDVVAQDDFRSQGGISPDPTGVLSGTILYRGPQPSCLYEGGKPKRVLGRVVLTLFRYDNPPPPAGRATTAENVLFVNGDTLFEADDCAGEGVPASDRAEVTRTAAFRWPQLELFADARDYQVRGFFDADENMNPFFSVTRLPTRGDVVGAALEDAQAQVPKFFRVELPAVQDASDGFARGNVLVTLGRVVQTERPIFRLGEARTLSAEATLDIPIDQAKLDTDLATCIDAPYLCVDRATMIAQMRTQSCTEVGESAEACDLALHAPVESEVAAAYARAGLAPSFAAEDRAYFATPVDLVSVRQGRADLRQPDGIADPHPLLGASANVPWYAPIVLMQRHALDAASAAREKAAGIPDVLLIGSVALDASGGRPLKTAFADTVPFAVPAIAAVDLDPSRTDCRVPYVPPGNVKNAYQTVFTHCGELPTGVYAANVIAGVAGGARIDDPDSEVGFSYRGGQDSGQSWSLPNELADPVQVGADVVLGAQGSSGLFVVHDPNPDATGDCTRAVDPMDKLLDPNAMATPIKFRTLCGDGEPTLYEAGPGVDSAGCLPDACCDGIRHLCGLPLCPVCDADGCPGLANNGLHVRLGPSAVTVPEAGGVAVPDCVPFAMPAQCCE